MLWDILKDIVYITMLIVLAFNIDHEREQIQQLRQDIVTITKISHDGVRLTR